MPNCTEKGKDFVNCKYTTACLRKDWFCDGEDDCWDNSDETNCTLPAKSNCKIDEFRCSDGTCIGASARCDQINDCDDMDSNGGISSDELNCRIGKNIVYSVESVPITRIKHIIHMLVHRFFRLHPFFKTGHKINQQPS